MCRTSEIKVRYMSNLVDWITKSTVCVKPQRSKYCKYCMCRTLKIEVLQVLYVSNLRDRSAASTVRCRTLVIRYPGYPISNHVLSTVNGHGVHNNSFVRPVILFVVTQLACVSWSPAVCVASTFVWRERPLAKYAVCFRLVMWFHLRFSQYLYSKNCNNRCI